MPEERRRRLTLDARREELLAHGAALFARQGPEDLSVDAIAAACGVSRALLYHYFDGKRGFYVAVLADAAERLLGVVPAPEGDLPAQLLAGLEGWFHSIDEDPHAHGALRRAATTDPSVSEIVDGQRAAFAGHVLVALPDEVATAPLVAGAVRAWLGAVERASMAWLERAPPAGAPARAAELDDQVTVLAAMLGGGLLVAVARDPAVPTAAAGAVDALVRDLVAGAVAGGGRTVRG